MGKAAESVVDRPVGGDVAGSVGGAGARPDAVLIDALAQRKVLAREQAREAALMLEFAEVRRVWDQRRIGEIEAEGRDARYTAGEFAAIEIGMAVKASRASVRNVMGVARRLRAETPDAYDAWLAGEIDQPRAVKINHALLRLTRDDSKQLLNACVVDVAVCRTAELLGRWLNEFVARVEPDQTDERLRRSLDDRYVSVRPDLDGISFLSAAVSSVDASAVDQVLTALAAAAEPGDSRTMQQRRADALVDVLLGRVSNGCHVAWVDDEDDEDRTVDDAGNSDHGTCDHRCGGPDGAIDDDDADCGREDRYRDSGSDGTDKETGYGDHRNDGDDAAGDRGRCDRPATADGPGYDSAASTDTIRVAAADPQVDAADADLRSESGTGTEGSKKSDDGPTDDWEQPASVFRPESQQDDPHIDTDSIDWDSADEPEPDGAEFDRADQSRHGDLSGRGDVSHRADQSRGSDKGSRGRIVVTPCPGNHQPNPVPAVIGVIVSAQSLFGFSNTPGQLIDRSALVPADTIRALAQQPGTLFHRLLTDERGNLLDVTELGRFPSRKLGLAINYRDGVCVRPGCHTSAARCDRDHVVPVPEGATTGINLKHECRPDHRAKTHAAHEVTSIDQHTTQWTTPTGHTYFNHAPRLPVENWPTADDVTDDPPSRE